MGRLELSMTGGVVCTCLLLVTTAAICFLHGIFAMKVRGCQQPACQMRMRIDAGGFMEQGDEDGLSDVFCCVWFTQLPARRAINHRRIAINQHPKGGLVFCGDELLQQLPIVHTRTSSQLWTQAALVR